MPKSQSRSIRVQISPDTEAELDKLALKYGCTYGGKASISYLLRRIADKSLTFKNNIFDDNENVDPPLLMLKLVAPFNLSGVVAVVLTIISNYKGNIYKKTTDSLTQGLGILNVYLSLKAKDFYHETKQIISIINEIGYLKLRDIEDYNSDSLLMNAYKVLMRLDNTSETPKEAHFINDIGFIFGWKIYADKDVNTIVEITKKIANRHIFISKIDYTFDPSINQGIISLFLEVQLRNPSDRKPEEISQIIDMFGDVPGVKRVERLGFDISL